jgi:hypothetical protein
MKIKFSRFNFLAVAILILLFGCVRKDPEEIASKILISYPVSQEISKASGVGMDIELINESDYCIVFPIVAGMKIYTEQGGSHVEVENLLTIIGDQNLVINPQGEIFSKRFVGIVPDTSDIEISGPTQFFVSLSGYLCNNENIKIIKEIPFTVIP